MMATSTLPLLLLRSMHLPCQLSRLYPNPPQMAGLSRPVTRHRQYQQPQWTQSPTSTVSLTTLGLLKVTPPNAPSTVLPSPSSPMTTSPLYRHQSALVRLPFHPEAPMTRTVSQTLTMLVRRRLSVVPGPVVLGQSRRTSGTRRSATQPSTDQTHASRTSVRRSVKMTPTPSSATVIHAGFAALLVHQRSSCVFCMTYIIGRSTGGRRNVNVIVTLIAARPRFSATDSYRQNTAIRQLRPLKPADLPLLPPPKISSCVLLVPDSLSKVIPGSVVISAGRVPLVVVLRLA